MTRSTTPVRSSLLDLLDPYAPTFATLWTGLLANAPQEAPLRVAFTSCEHGDGTTTAAACAAISLALHGGREVVLVEANAHRPGLAELLGLPAGPGLEEVRSGEVALESAVRETDLPGLRVLTVGVPKVTSVPPRAAELSRIWQNLAGENCHLIVDAPPAPAHPQTVPILASLDGVILVLNARRTKRGDVRPVLRSLDSAGIPLLGTLLNRCTRGLPAWLRPPR
ncbi:MAG: CpsD/CapB family tyrosine-protein kinase [Planctomycetes bacterium]|nr:CpsD/CapB family tyrosine-protein kinase [Planctomycetota bacterium]